MKSLVVYSSRGGNTAEVARAIHAALGPKCALAEAVAAPPPEAFDFIALGFGVYNGWPDGDMRAYMKRCRRKNIGIFLTLGAYPDSEAALQCVGRAEGLLENCTTRVKFICQGRYTEGHLARMKSRPGTSPHAWNEERAARVAEAMKHPDEADLKTAADRFRAAAEKLKTAAPRPAKPEKRAKVLAVFGSTVPSAAAAYRTMETALRERNPELPLFVGWTSQFVRSRRPGSPPSLSGVLRQLVLDGFTAADVTVGYLSTGEEYEKLKREASAFDTQLDLRITVPPLSNRAALLPFLAAVKSGLAPLADDECVLFMGHGNADGRADFAYLAVNAELAKLGPALHLACVEGEPPLDSVLIGLKPRVRLVPFMIVAGDHALNDMSVSWKSRLEAAGHTCECVLHGLGENPAVARYYAEL